MLRFVVLLPLLACAANGATTHEQAVECRNKINKMRKSVLERIETISRDIHISPQWGACPSGAKLGCKFSGGKAVPITAPPTPPPKLSKYKGRPVPLDWSKSNPNECGQENTACKVSWGEVNTGFQHNIKVDKITMTGQGKANRTVKAQRTTKTTAGVCRLTKVTAVRVFDKKKWVNEWANAASDGDDLPDDSCCDACTDKQYCVQDANGCHCYDIDEGVSRVKEMGGRRTAAVSTGPTGVLNAGVLSALSRVSGAAVTTTVTATVNISTFEQTIAPIRDLEAHCLHQMLQNRTLFVVAANPWKLDQYRNAEWQSATVDSFDCHKHCGCTADQACKYDRNGCECWEPAGVKSFCTKECAQGRRLQMGDVAGVAGSDDVGGACAAAGLCSNCDNCADDEYCVCDRDNPEGRCEKIPEENKFAGALMAERQAVSQLAAQVTELAAQVQVIRDKLVHGRVIDKNTTKSIESVLPWISKIVDLTDSKNDRTDMIYGTQGLMARQWNAKCATQFGMPEKPVLKNGVADFDECCKKCGPDQACSSTADGGCVCWDVNPMYDTCPTQSSSVLGACDDDLPDDSCCDACTDTQMCVQDANGCTCHDIGGDEVKVLGPSGRRTV